MNPNISFSHYNTGTYVVSEYLFSLKLEDCLTPLVEQRNKPTLTLATMTQGKALVKRESRITFVVLAAGKIYLPLGQDIVDGIRVSYNVTSHYINNIVCTLGFASAGRFCVLSLFVKHT